MVKKLLRRKKKNNKWLHNIDTLDVIDALMSLEWELEEGEYFVDNNITKNEMLYHIRELITFLSDQEAQESASSMWKTFFENDKDEWIREDFRTKEIIGNAE